MADLVAETGSSLPPEALAQIHDETVADLASLLHRQGVISLGGYNIFGGVRHLIAKHTQAYLMNQQAVNQAGMTEQHVVQNG